MALKKAVNEAYEYIDEKVRGFLQAADSPYPVNIQDVQDLISSFAGTSKKPGFFFTLNQDLFLERKYHKLESPTLPGIQHRPNWFTSNGSESLQAERCIIPDSGTNIRLDDSRFYYLKLHGSSNWYAAGEQAMVIGHAKQTQIAAQPLLSKYFDTFRTVLAGEGRRLLCLGYGFSDEHINTAIKEGVEVGLRVYVLSPESPDGLFPRLKQRGETGEIILRGLAGYFQTDLKTLFPAGQSTHNITAECKLLDNGFFK